MAHSAGFKWQYMCWRILLTLCMCVYTCEGRSGAIALCHQYIVLYVYCCRVASSSYLIPQCAACAYAPYIEMPLLGNAPPTNIFPCLLYLVRYSDWDVSLWPQKNFVPYMYILTFVYMLQNSTRECAFLCEAHARTHSLRTIFVQTKRSLKSFRIEHALNVRNDDIVHINARIVLRKMSQPSPKGRPHRKRECVCACI